MRVENRNGRTVRATRRAAAALLAGFVAAAALGDEVRAMLPVTVNRVARGDFLVVMRGEDVLLRVAELEAAGVRGFAGSRVAVGGDEFVSLSSLGPAVAFAVDHEALTLALTVPPEWLGVTVVNMAVGRPPGIAYSRDTSGFLNYTGSWRDMADIEGFAEAGLSVAGNLLYSSVSRDAGGRFVRGQSNLTVDRRERLQRIVLGDATASSGELGGSLFLGGISVARNYDLDPYFIPFPAMKLGGAVTTPSRADIYVNGVLVRRQELAPGMFDLTNLQLPTGAGDVQVVIRDALGQERVLANPFYASTQVLDAGYQEYSYNLGLRRDNVATESAAYGSLVFLGHHRFGWTDSVTPEARLEVGRGLASGGVGLAWRARAGEFSADIAASREDGTTGSAGSLSYRYVGRPFGVGLLLRRTGSSYATASMGAAADRSTLDVNAFAGVQLSRRLSLTAQYIGSRMRDAGVARRAALIATLANPGLGSIFASIGRTTSSGRSSAELFLGYSYGFGATAVASASYARQQGIGTTTVNVQQPVPIGEGIGYQASVSTASGTSFGTGLFQYQGRYGRYDLQLDHSTAGDVTTLSVTGGVVMIGGELLATRNVGDSFALVRVPDLGGVTALANNQPIGRTDASGDVLVPGLLAYYGNRLGIRDTEIPLDYEVGVTERTVAPPYRGGAVVSFPVRRIQSFRGRLVVTTPKGELVPAFGQVTVGVAGRDVVSPLGPGGDFEFENLPSGEYRALAEFKEGTCVFTLNVPRAREQFVDLGAVRCPAPELQ